MRGIDCRSVRVAIGFTLLAAATVPARADEGTLMVVDDFAHRRSRIVSSASFPRQSGQRAAARTLGRKTIAVLLINFSNDRSQPLTVQQVADEMFIGPASTGAFLQAQSQGRLQLGGIADPAGDVFGYFELAAASDPCDTVAWAEEAFALALERGIDLTGYDHTIFLHNDSGACDYGGVGELGGSIIFLQASARGAAGHELGHNFGLLHANAFVCRGDQGIATLSGDCDSLEYGDQYSMMGGGPIHQLNHWEKVKLGWMDAGDIERVEASGSWSIAAASAPAGRRGLHIHRMVDCVARDYFVEYRPGADFDTAAPEPGVLVRLAPGDPAVGSRSHLLDMTPATGGGATDQDREHGMTDAALPVGATYSDPDAGVAITLTGASPEEAQVSVQIKERLPPHLGVGWDPRVAWFADPDLTIPAVTTSDPALDFEWGTGAPLSEVPADGFSLRFDGFLAPASQGLFRFVTMSDDGVRLWVDDQLLIDAWIIQAATRNTADLRLGTDRVHRVRLEYFDHGGEASLRLGWQKDGSACQVMSFSAPPPDADPAEPDDMLGGCATTRPSGLLASLLLLAATGLYRMRARRARR